jgi:hypothetical protein
MIFIDTLNTINWLFGKNMAQQIINVGSSINSRDGDAIRTAFTKVNANFSELFIAFKGWQVIRSNYIAQNGDRIIADTSGGPFTIALPDNPTESFYIEIADGGNFAENNLLLTSVEPVEGFDQDIIFDIKGLSLEFVYVGTSWQILTTLGVKGDKGDPGLNVVDVPSSSSGSEGDKQGMVAFDNSYFYYCISDFDTSTIIWKRVAWSNDTWGE